MDIQENNPSLFYVCSRFADFNDRVEVKIVSSDFVYDVSNLNYVQVARKLVLQFEDNSQWPLTPVLLLPWIRTRFEVSIRL